MNLKTRTRRAAGVAVAAVAAALVLSACGTDSNRCSTTQPMFYSVTDHTYHYGSITGPKVPTSKVPPTAAKVPGYKPYNPPKPAAPKLNKGPGPGYKVPAPKPAAPRIGKR